MAVNTLAHLGDDNLKRKKMMKTIYYFLSAAAAVAGPSQAAQIVGNNRKPLGEGRFLTIGEIIKYSDKLDEIIPPKSVIEVLAEGFTWTEGPLWLPQENALLFVQPRSNQMLRWSAADGVSIFLEPSGLQRPDPKFYRAPGINGSFMKPDGLVLVANQGDRAIQELNVQTKQRRDLVTHYQGKRLNGPNDVVVGKSGAIYFTDLGSGLLDAKTNPLRELDFFGTFRIDPDGTVAVVDSSPIRPNGIGLSPDEKTLYVGASELKTTHIRAYTLNGRGEVLESRMFFDGSTLVWDGSRGVCDGLKVDREGNVFASAPGGLLIFNPQGEKLGLISTNTEISNCVLARDGYLYLTARSRLIRVKTRSRPLW